jgi:hypothetical protein
LLKILAYAFDSNMKDSVMENNPYMKLSVLR